MIRIDYLLFGYVIFRIPVADISTLAKRLLKASLSAKITNDGVIVVRASMKSKVEQLLYDIEYTVSEPKGLFGALFRLRRRYGIIAAAIISIMLLLLSRTVVWDVRVDGIDGEDRDKLISELSQCGLSVGSMWHRINTAEVEAKTLLSSDSVAWLNINRRGTVAYVTALPKTVTETENKSGVYCNIVAARDCVIEEITVKRGIALVKVGETVRAGTVLISGVIPTELGGGVCYAEGSVKGRFSDTVTYFSPKTVSEKRYSSSVVSSLGVKIFQNQINIFKKYRNFQDSCDIIEKKQRIHLFGVALPITVHTQECREYTVEELTLGDDELTELVADKLSHLIAEKSAELTLVSIKTDGAFTDGGYFMSAELIAVGDVAEMQEFYRE